jgi:hypothetical protein
MKKVDVCFTSTARWDLLRITIESFLKFNTYNINRFHIHDDSGQPIPEDLQNDFPFIIWTQPAERIIHNQIRSLDFLWWSCETEYAFFGEDDWEFYRSGFIEESMTIMEAHPKILQVWLRELEDTNKHPIEWNLGESFGRLKVNNGLWSGTRFNPGLKRKADYDLIGSYGKYATFDREKPWKAEATISQVYYKLGFSAAILPLGYIKHIGINRHVS